MREGDWTFAPPSHIRKRALFCGRRRGLDRRMVEQPWDTSRGSSVASVARCTTSPRSTSARCASGRSKSPTTTTSIRADISREEIDARAPARVWRYRALLPVEGDRRGRHPDRLHAARQAPTTSASARACATSTSRTTPSTRRFSFKDRPVSIAASKRARVRLRHASPAPPPATWRRRSPPTRPRRGCAASSSSRPTWSRQDRGHRRLRPDARRRRRQLRRRQPPLQRDRRPATTGRSSTSTCARTTPRAARRWPSRSPSSLAGALPDCASCRSPAARCSPRSGRASTSWSKSGWSSPARPPDGRGAGRGLLAGRPRRTRRTP